MVIPGESFVNDKAKIKILNLAVESDGVVI